MKKLTTENFIERAKLVHGDFYDYTFVDYKNNSTKVKIICPIHGEFWQKPQYHVDGSKCPECSKKDSSKKRSKNIDDFIKEAREIHGDKYDYSKVDYKNNSTKVKIICPIHGEFLMKPLNHISQKQGCPICGGTGKLTQTEFIERAKKIHGNKYDYSKVEYKNYSTKVCIICHELDEFGKEHGEFWQTPQHHLNGYGCKKCSKNFMNTEMFIDKAKKIHGNKYDYSKTNYINQKTKVCIVCPKHGDFWQMPTEHLKGAGCPKCSGTRYELIIMSLLDEYGIEYEFQKTFPWLKFHKQLYLDFYLPKQNVAIEFQGEQHYKPINFRNDREIDLIKSFNLIQKRDEIKKHLCEKNGVRIFYISYKDTKRIKEIISDIINESTNKTINN